MAFDKKFKNSGNALCPICRRPYTDGRSIVEKAYHKGCGKMCKDCMNQFYRDSGRSAAISDDPVNLLVRLRPAQILERPRLMHRDVPRGGYEFVMPELCAQQIVQNLVVWVTLCFMIGLLGGTGSKEHISMLVMDILITLFTIAWMIHDVFQLLKGLLLGMGHTRRILLLVSALIKFLLAWHFFPLYLFNP